MGICQSVRAVSPFAASFLFCASLWASPAEDAYQKGDYKKALQQFQKTKGMVGSLGQAKVYATTGREDKAQKALKACGTHPDCRVFSAELDISLGNYQAAQTKMEILFRKKKHPLRARLVLGRALLAQGKKSEAKSVLETFYDDWEADKIDQNDGHALMYVAIAAALMGGFEDANDTFRSSLAKDPSLLEANIEWGKIFLEKYSAGNAEQSFSEVLKINPHHPDALWGMAKVKIVQSYDVKSAGDYLAKALEINPSHAAALRLSAQLEIDDGAHERARKLLAKVLERNPNDLVARSLLAASYWLSDQNQLFKKEESLVFKKHASYAAFFHVLAEAAVREHRYSEAIKLEERALKIDPDYHLSHAGIGTGYLRLGDEKKGLEHLNKAFSRDPYNVRVYNMLNLFDEVIPQEYTFIEGKALRFRVKKDEEKMLARTIPRFLEPVFADMVKRYGYRPKKKVTIELYQKSEHYSVRTVGLPNIGALGVCFGNVITAISPSGGSVNWAMVLWHELSHTFALALSKGRVARWYTEGLSEYETIIARPEWRRENDLDVYLALVDGNLPSVAELNRRFTRARNMQEMVVAYHMSSLAIEFMAQSWGFPKIVEGLKAFGSGKKTPQVIKVVTGLDVDQFDKKFQSYLRSRFSHYGKTKQFSVDLSLYADLVAAEKKLATESDNSEYLCDLGLAYWLDGQKDKAKSSLKRALNKNPKLKRAIYGLAVMALQERQGQESYSLFQKLVLAGGDSYQIQIQMAQVAKPESKAMAHWKNAKRLNPQGSLPYYKMSEHYFKNGQEDLGLKELESYAMLEQMELAPTKKLAEAYRKKKEWAKVVRFAQMGLNIYPFDPNLHLLLAEGLGQSKSGYKEAIYSYESALVAEPPLRRPALVHIGMSKLHLRNKKSKKAKAAIKQALRLEPDNVEAKAVAVQLGLKP